MVYLLSMKKSWPAALGFLLLTGCYESVPLGTVDPLPGKEVVVELTAGGGMRLASSIGPGAMSLSGIMRAAGPDTIGVAVKAVTQEGGEERFWRGERVAIARADISRISERRLSRPKSGLAAALLVAAAWAVHQSFGGTTGTKNKPSGTPTGR